MSGSKLTWLHHLLGKRPVTIKSLLTNGEIATLIEEYRGRDMVDSESLIVIAKQRGGLLQLGIAGEAKNDDILALQMLFHAGDMLVSGDGDDQDKLEETEGD